MGKIKKYFLVIILLLAAVLRLYGMAKVPPSLFADEVDVGYHAYSILKTGKDYRGNFLPLLFESQADARAPLYIYSAVPTVAVFGITPYGVRLPAVLFGILAIYFIYLLVKEVFKDESLALVSSFLLTISPWHIHYSRAGFEVTLMLALFLGGLYFFFKGLRKSKFLIISALFFGLTTWAYSTAKMVIPLTLLFLIIFWFKELKKINRKSILTAFIVLLLITLPNVWVTFGAGGAKRFNYISIFYNPNLDEQVDYGRYQAARARGETELGTKPKLLDYLFHNKGLYLTDIFIENYFKAFSGGFLFVNGDQNPRHSLEGFGEFYLIQAILLLVGALYLIKAMKNKKNLHLLLFLLLIAPIPAALTWEGGVHATRLFFLLIPLIILMALGGKILIKTFPKIIPILLGAILLLEIISYQYYYWGSYSLDSQLWWHYGFKETVAAVKEIEGGYDKVLINTAGEPPLIFFLGFYPYPPEKLHGYDFPPKSLDNKYYFVASSDYLISLDSGTLVVVPAVEFAPDFQVPGKFEVLRTVSYPSGDPAFYLLTAK